MSRRVAKITIFPRISVSREQQTSASPLALPDSLVSGSYVSQGHVGSGEGPFRQQHHGWTGYQDGVAATFNFEPLGTVFYQGSVFNGASSAGAYMADAGSDLVLKDCSDTVNVPCGLAAFTTTQGKIALYTVARVANCVIESGYERAPNLSSQNSKSLIDIAVGNFVIGIDEAKQACTASSSTPTPVPPTPVAPTSQPILGQTDPGVFALSASDFGTVVQINNSTVESNEAATQDKLIVHLGRPFAEQGRVTGYFMAAVVSAGTHSAELHYLVSVYGTPTQAHDALSEQSSGWETLVAHPSSGVTAERLPEVSTVGEVGARWYYRALVPTSSGDLYMEEILFQRGQVVIEVWGAWFKSDPPAADYAHRNRSIAEKLDNIAILYAQSSRSSNPSPTPTAVPPTASKPARLLSTKGSGPHTTRSFLTPSAWKVQWSFTCSSQQKPQRFRLDLFLAGGKKSNLTNIDRSATNLRGTEYYHQAGRYYFSIRTRCNWKVYVSTAPGESVSQRESSGALLDVAKHLQERHEKGAGLHFLALRNR